MGAINIAQQVSGEFWQPRGMNVFGNVILQESFGLVSIESQSVAECRRVSQSVAECRRVSQSMAEYRRGLISIESQGVTECCRVL